MTTRVSEPIAKCRCGRLFNPMQWAELTGSGVQRACPCGLVAVKIQPITLDDIQKLYRKELDQAWDAAGEDE